jgi:biotin operon repressor
MESIGDLARQKSQELKQRENTIRIVGADPMSQRGFTQVPNFILMNDKLYVGAKITYAMLLKYAWYDDHCFPGQTKLASDIGSSERSVRTYLKELENSGYITIKQRGLGKVNVYELHLRVKKS